ncbi:MAG: pentapeptide repeat-containing protein [Polyangiaceae bacterium]|nr:pentapeptide repeat-containing protein [Polyangiaceae bacterium]
MRHRGGTRRRCRRRKRSGVCYHRASEGVDWGSSGSGLGCRRLTGARCDGARNNSSRSNGARLNGARLNGARLNGTRLNGTRLNGAWRRLNGGSGLRRCGSDGGLNSTNGRRSDSDHGALHGQSLLGGASIYWGLGSESRGRCGRGSESRLGGCRYRSGRGCRGGRRLAGFGSLSRLGKPWRRVHHEHSALELGRSRAL